MLLPVIEEEIKQVQAVFELIRIEVSDNIPETIVVESREEVKNNEEGDLDIIEFRPEKKQYCID